MRRLALAGMVAALAGLAVPAQGQVPASNLPPTHELVFAGTTFDVTGAGVLELGDLDALLQPFKRGFSNGRERLAVAVTVDAAGGVIACSTQGVRRLDRAGQTLCAHALANGRFVQNSLLVLDYSAATYRFTIRSSSSRPPPGTPDFLLETGFPHEGEFVRFGSFPIPPEEERLSLADVRMGAMDFPAVASRHGIEARVEVLLTFNDAGQVVTCRPLTSSNTARMAYESCYAARRVTRLNRPPDTRPFAFATRWMLGD